MAASFNQSTATPFFNFFLIYADNPIGAGIEPPFRRENKKVS
jgi:hypothetical protein